MALNATLSYEIKAEAFRLMTGHMAPGKDAPAATYPAPFEVRAKAYDAWLAQYSEIIRVMLLAVERIMVE